MLDLLIITGASRGIGNSISNKCSTICQDMIAISSSEKIDDVKFDSCETLPLQLDLTDYNSTYHGLKKIIESMNTIELIKSIGIVLCAAQLGEHGGLFDTDLNDWERLYKCNVLGNLAIVKACEEVIKSGAKTRIVMFGGGGAAMGYPDFFGYSLSKCAAVRGTENLAMELEKINDDVSVVILAPGAVKTQMLDRVLASGAKINTYAKIEEATDFCYNFLTDQFPSKELNGRFLHVRDDIQSADLSNKELFKLRRIQ